MSRAEIGERHPLCDCPEITFSSAPSAAEIEACRERSGGITHALINAEDIREMTAALNARIRIQTRPQDWAEPARSILYERGAWRA